MAESNRWEQEAPAWSHRYVARDEVPECLRDHPGEFVLVRNEETPYPPAELVLLAPKQIRLSGHPAAILFDMDGTTTTTETLCCAGMEEMIRRMSGLREDRWAGLDRERDYPALIGYSGVRNFEYLSMQYGHLFSMRHTQEAYLDALAWNMSIHGDPAVQTALASSLSAAGLRPLLECPELAALQERTLTEQGKAIHREKITTICGEQLGSFLSGNLMHAGLTIYCHFYHQHISGQHAPEITPIPGVGVAMALAKGWLGGAAVRCLDVLRPGHGGGARGNAAHDGLARLGERFARRPAKLALVTSSSAYEAGHVLRHLFARLREEVRTWNLPGEVEARILAGFAAPEACYDAVVTSSDLSRSRLKPHRDPYSLALHRLNLRPADPAQTIGFEDTEPGILSLRAAGVGVTVAVPFAGTHAHDFRAASHVLPGGFPQAILDFGLFLPDGRRN